MKKVFMLMMVVISLVGFNAAIVNAQETSVGTKAIIVPLRHGVDH
ncbi:hypothetical protein [Paenibacillus donghaensis]|nr:hypothetical protein [Paenibacillus donghaensis]